MEENPDQSLDFSEQEIRESLDSDAISDDDESVVNEDKDEYDPAFAFLDDCTDMSTDTESVADRDLPRKKKSLRHEKTITIRKVMKTLILQLKRGKVIINAI